MSSTCRAKKFSRNYVISPSASCSFEIISFTFYESWLRFIVKALKHYTQFFYCVQVILLKFVPSVCVFLINNSNFNGRVRIKHHFFQKWVKRQDWRIKCSRRPKLLKARRRLQFQPVCTHKQFSPLSYIYQIPCLRPIPLAPYSASTCCSRQK
jgi:hypothetical protein